MAGDSSPWERTKSAIPHLLGGSKEACEEHQNETLSRKGKQGKSSTEKRNGGATEKQIEEDILRNSENEKTTKKEQLISTKRFQEGSLQGI